ncbi:hypothetical protein BABINDRAFT_6819 [Babjeviella inositovora NRRL Y-12698]|uniref:TRIP4/RQT4 C2HC5-type zinc finger domain-containing protein n=1 Tax=Babjeviella inositovora NRRL Y-12698 TaxID=984486 RepID=A0A1E3QTC4_9ASCO|nr:uncharacterized protein BABINDRAFT_6819 [Babjeviella inositovora NRRL Y-12698]ODQ80955.1 hypothetical protein BABINDRAFT_6819 [Babjeviella inositovora NRRL Y-12698]
MDARSYGIKTLKDLLPLDQDALTQVIDYALSLPSDDIVVDHFLNLLGESPDAIDFVTKFNLYRRPATKAPMAAALKKERTPTPAAEPVKPKNATSNSVWGTSPQPQAPKATKPRLAGTKTSTTVAELLDTKPVKEPLTAQQKAKKAAKKKLTDLKDIDAALAALEYRETGAEADAEDRRSCNCMATRHPLFDVFPNCLNCGKIICVKEGLQPCSYCGQPLISWTERAQMVEALQSQRLELEGKKAPVSENNSGRNSPSVKLPQKKFKITIGAPGQNSFKAQEWAMGRLAEHNKEKAARLAQEAEKTEKITKQDEELQYYSSMKDIDPDLQNAQDRLNTLLNFQSTGAQRTRIIDQASDYDAPATSGSLWASPLERALQLKKQQRMARKQEEAMATRSGRGKRVMDLTIRDGKAVIHEKQVSGDIKDDDAIDLELVDSEDEELKEIKELEQQANVARMEEDAKKQTNVWDYEADKKKWVAPIYVSSSDIKDEKEVEEAVGKGWSRVQLSTPEDPDELVAEI